MKTRKYKINKNKYKNAGLQEQQAGSEAGQKGPLDGLGVTLPRPRPEVHVGNRTAGLTLGSGRYFISGLLD